MAPRGLLTTEEHNRQRKAKAYWLARDTDSIPGFATGAAALLAFELVRRIKDIKDQRPHPEKARV
jgi:hypothetical protein